MVEKEKKVDEADLKLCKEHRAKMELPDYNNLSNFKCKESPKDAALLRCYDAGCPVLKNTPTPKTPPNNPLGINLNVFEEIKPDKPKKEKITIEIKDFLKLQARVIDRLAWNPEIWKALDNMGTEEILDRLLGKSTAETIPFQIGGRMDVKPSKKTEKLFAKLEKQYAEEDEKTGKKPYNFTTEEKGDWGGLGDCRDPYESNQPPKKEGEKKKNGKKPD